MFLVGDVTVLQAVEKEFDGRKYYKCQGLASDKTVYSFSCRFEDHPKEGDTFQMYIQPSSKDFKAQAFYQKVK